MPRALQVGSADSRAALSHQNANPMGRQLHCGMSDGSIRVNVTYEVDHMQKEMLAAESATSRTDVIESPVACPCSHPGGPGVETLNPKPCTTQPGAEQHQRPGAVPATNPFLNFWGPCCRPAALEALDHNQVRININIPVPARKAVDQEPSAYYFATVQGVRLHWTCLISHQVLVRLEAEAQGGGPRAAYCFATVQRVCLKFDCVSSNLKTVK